MKAPLTVDRLREVLEYNQHNGMFTWRLTLASPGPKGTFAGSASMFGYMRVKIDGREYPSHRLAWLYMTGEWPPTPIDHINNTRHDNRWTNLRLATPRQNQGNRGPTKRNKLGLKGVRFVPNRGKYRATIYINKKGVYLGTFATASEASEAYLNAAIQHFGAEFARAV